MRPGSDRAAPTAWCISPTCRRAPMPSMSGTRSSSPVIPRRSCRLRSMILLPRATWPCRCRCCPIRGGGWTTSGCGTEAMGFRLRLASPFVAVLAIVQALTALLVYEVTRRQVIADGTRQLTEAAGTFVRQLDDVSERVAESVQVLALDFALRSAIAEHDRGTVLSV